MNSVSIKIHKASRLSCVDFLVFLILIMPFVDSFSGAFHDLYPIGQIYRSIFFSYMLFMVMRHSKREFMKIGIPFSVFAIVQMLISIDMQKSAQDIVKLFTPIILIRLMLILIDGKKLEINNVKKLIERWAVCYPVLIIVPGILGIGKIAYDGTAGWKGFFYATNEISFIISCLVMFLVWEVYKDIKLKMLILLGMNILTVLLMGTKTGYATVGVFVLIYFAKSMGELRRSRFLKNIFIVLVSCIAVGYLYHLFFDEINAIFERWMYQKDVVSYSLIDFLTSHRLRRFQAAWNSFIHGEIWYIPFGCGFGAELGGFENMEMDWIDILFRTGFLGTSFIIAFYLRCFLHISRNNFWGFVIMLWIFFLSFGAGHVLFYGQSGMMLGIMVVMCYLIQIDNKKNIKIFFPFFKK